MSATGLHGGLFFFPHASLLDERRTLGLGGGWVAFQPDFAQLCSFLFGCAVNKVLQEAGTKGITLYVQHCTGTVTEKEDGVYG